MSENIKSEIQDPDGICEAEKLALESNKIRTELVDKLMTAIRGQDFKLADWDAEDKEAIMSIVNATGSLLNSRDTAVLNIAKLRVASKREDREAGNSAIIAELLNKISTTPVQGLYVTTTKDIDIDKQLEESFAAAKGTVTEEELAPVIKE